MIEIATIDQIEDAVNSVDCRSGFWPYTDDDILFSEFYDRLGNIAYRETETGATALFCRREEDPHMYEIHMILPRGARVKKGLDIIRGMARYMLRYHGAHVIRGEPPARNRAVRVFGYRLGFRRTDDPPFMRNGEEHLVYEWRL